MEPLKNVYDGLFIQQLAERLKVVDLSFDVKGFRQSVTAGDWQQLELKQRMRRISTEMQKHLKGDYKQQLDAICKLTEHLLAEGGVSSFPYLCLPDFIEQYGPGDLKTSLDAMELITQFISCEFAIRPFLLAAPDRVMKRMLKWSTHKHANVRRFSSEGCRPRLPWGAAIPSLKKDPSPIIPILDNLKDDPSEFVRKSVANNLNDIAKDNPSVVLGLLKQWKGKSAKTDWILKHGARTLLRKADADVYEIFGLSGVHDCKLSDFKLSSKTINTGDVLTIHFVLTNEAAGGQLFRVEMGVDYVKSNGSHSRKLFKLSERIFEPGAGSAFKRKLSFADLTTRRHYPGKHIISIIVNGKELGMKTVTLK